MTEEKLQQQEQQAEEEEVIRIRNERENSSTHTYIHTHCTGSLEITSLTLRFGNIQGKNGGMQARDCGWCGNWGNDPYGGGGGGCGGWRSSYEITINMCMDVVDDDEPWVKLYHECCCCCCKMQSHSQLDSWPFAFFSRVTKVCSFLRTASSSFSE